MNLRKLGLGAAFALAATMVAGTAEAQLKDITQIGPTVPGGAINKSFVQEIGAGRGEHLHCRTRRGSSSTAIRSAPSGAAGRSSSASSSVAQGNGPLTNDGVGNPAFIGGDPSVAAGLADSCAACHGRPARIGRPRRRRRHASGQPRRAPPVRPRPAGAARRRDDHRAARDPRRGAQPGRGERDGGDAAARRQGRQLRLDHRQSPTSPSTRRPWWASIRISASVRSSPRASRSPSVSSSSARSTPRWAWKSFDNDLILAAGGGDVADALGHVAERQHRQDRDRAGRLAHRGRRSGRGGRRDPGVHRRLRGVLPAALLQGGDAGDADEQLGGDDGPRDVHGDRLHHVPPADVHDRRRIGASPTWRRTSATSTRRCR